MAIPYDYIAGAGSSVLADLVNKVQNSPTAAIPNAIRSIQEQTARGPFGNIPLTTTQSTMPQYQPIPRVAPAQMRMDQREFSSGTANNRVAMQNMFSNVGALVKQYGEQREAKQERNLQMDMQRLFEAQEGMQQAQASGDAKMADHNKAIIDSIMGDPKKAKAIEKAFNINLLGDDKGKDSVERKALLKAYAEWKQGGSKGENPVAKQASERLAAAMPQIQALNPYLVAQLDLMKKFKEGGGVTDTERFKAQTDLLIEQARGDRVKEVAVLNGQSRIQAAQIAADAARYGHMMSYYGRLDQETQKGLNELSKIQEKFQNDLSKPENLKDLEKTTQTTLKNMKDSLKASQQKLKDQPTFGAATEKARINKDIEFKTKQIQRLESVQNMIQGMVERGRGISNPNQSGDTGSSSTNKGTDTGAASSSASAATEPSQPAKTGGLPPELIDLFFDNFFSWGGRNAPERDPYKDRPIL